MHATSGSDRIPKGRVIDVVTVLVLGTLIWSASPAEAQTELLTCTGTQTTSWDPGLRLFEQQVDVTGVNNLALCEGADPDIESGLISFATPATLSCLTLAGSGSGSNVINWSDGSTSTFTFTFTTVTVGALDIATFTGSITDGTFDGNTAVMVVIQPVVDLLDCFNPPGLQQTVGVSELTITSASPN